MSITEVKKMSKIPLYQLYFFQNAKKTSERKRHQKNFHPVDVFLTLNGHLLDVFAQWVATTVEESEMRGIQLVAICNLSARCH